MKTTKKSSHREKDQVDLMCMECNRGFVLKSNLIFHVKHVHHKLRPFHCELCDGKSFSTNVVLSRHIKSVHYQERDMICTYCEKTFSRDLARHAKDVHLLAHQFKCDECEKIYSQKTTLSSHRRQVHTKERNHKCPECDEAFF